MSDTNVNPIEELEIVYVPIDSIHPNTYNPNRQSDHEFELLCRSIEEDGFTQPVLVHKPTMEIVDGEHRWRACKILAWTTIPVILKDYSEAQRMIATLRHNRARGSEDISMAADILKAIHLEGNIDIASDSLIMDEIELQVMLEDIPNAEIQLRHAGDKLTIDEVENLIHEEKENDKERQAQEAQTKNKDRLSSTTLRFVYNIFESGIVKEVLGKDHAQGLIAICKEFE